MLGAGEGLVKVGRGRGAFRLCGLPRGEPGRGRGWRVLAMMAMPAMQAVHALPALQARLVGLWFDSGLPPFGRLRAGSSAGSGRALGRITGRRFDKLRTGSASPLGEGEDCRASWVSGSLRGCRRGAHDRKTPHPALSPRRGIKSGCKCEIRGCFAKVSQGEKEKNGALEGGCRFRAGWFDTVLRGLRTGSPRTVSRVASTGRRAGRGRWALG